MSVTLRKVAVILAATAFLAAASISTDALARGGHGGGHEVAEVTELNTAAVIKVVTEVPTTVVATTVVATMAARSHAVGPIVPVGAITEALGTVLDDDGTAVARGPMAWAGVGSCRQ